MGSLAVRRDLTFCEMTHKVRVGERTVEESDLSAIRLGIESHTTPEGKPLKFGEEEIGKALKLLARRKMVHPVREWLSGLKWDGRNRMDVEFPAALGQPEGSFAGVLLGRWLISAVARPMEPGCKVDTVLVLVGPQGAGKSTFFNALAGDEWFTDSPVNVGDRDGKMLMREKWIVEWAELDAMRRARDKEAIRGFLSQRIDHFREPYGRGMVTAPRGCVIVGTTNNREFLSDFERRFCRWRSRRWTSRGCTRTASRSWRRPWRGTAPASSTTWGPRR
jgi:predicted P-loop ATPase